MRENEQDYGDLDGYMVENLAMVMLLQVSQPQTLLLRCLLLAFFTGVINTAGTKQSIPAFEYLKAAQFSAEKHLKESNSRGHFYGNIKWRIKDGQN